MSILEDRGTQSHSLGNLTKMEQAKGGKSYISSWQMEILQALKALKKSPLKNIFFKIFSFRRKEKSLQSFLNGFVPLKD